MNRNPRYLVLHLALLCSLAALIAACDPTYNPVCRGRGNQPLGRDELAQPSGMALGNGKLFVANAASESPSGDYDFCGSFISVHDPITGKTLQNPILPTDAGLPEAEQNFRFFSAITYDTERNALFVAERQRGSVLMVNPSNGDILGRVASGRGPISMVLMSNVPTLWPGDATTVSRDLLAVADLGTGGREGHLWLIDIDNFNFLGAQEYKIEAEGRPAGLAYDAAEHRLYVSLFDGFGIAVIDVAARETLTITEDVLENFRMLIRTVVPVTEGTSKRIYFSSESSAFGGVWSADGETGELLANHRLPLPPIELAAYKDQLLGIARNRFYTMERNPVRLIRTDVLGLANPSHLLVDEANERAYVTSVAPSAVRVLRLP